MTERSARLDRTIWLLAFLVLGAFLLISDLNQQPKASFPAMLDGTAHRPYVNRLLVPQGAQIVGALLPDAARAAIAAWSEGNAIGYALDWIAVPSERAVEMGVVTLLLYASLVGFTYGLRRLALTLQIAHANRLALLGLVGLTLFFQHGYIYDFPALLLWTWLFVTVAQARWSLFLILTAAAAFNKETVLLLPAFWLAYGWFLGAEQRRRLPYWSLFGAQIAIVVPIYLAISWLHRNNPGGVVEFNWRVHLDVYMAAPAAILLVVAAILAVLLLAWRDAPALLRGGAVLLLPLSGLYLLFGWPYEFRVFYEIYPVLILFTALAAYRLEALRTHDRTASSAISSAIGGDEAARLLLLTALLVGFALRVVGLDRLPPALSNAEALNGVLALEWMPARANVTTALTALVYRPLISLLGPEPIALRLTSAWLGVVMLPLLYATGRALSRHAHARVGMWPAVSAVAALALAYPHVSLSRLGVAAILPALLTLLALYLFWRAWQRPNRPAFALAGVTLAAACYAGIAGWLLVGACLLFALFEAALRADFKQPYMRSRLLGGGIMAFVWLLCVLPLGLAIGDRGDALVAGLAQPSIFAAPWESMPGSPRERLGANLGALAQAFLLQGDSLPLANLPGRPLNDWLMGILAAFGVVGVIRTVDRSATRLLVFWLCAMSIATLAVVNAPNTLRLSALLPPLALLTALGAWEAVRWLPATWRTEAVATSLVVLLLLISGGITVRDYFGRWAGMPELGQVFASEAQAAVELLQDHDDGSLLLPSSLWLTPQRRFGIPMIDARAELPAAPTDSMLLTGAETPTIERLFWLTPRSEGYAARGVELATEIDVEAGDADVGTLRLLPVRDAVLTPTTPAVGLRARFANGLTLLGYDVAPAVAEAGDAVTVTTYWQREPGAVQPDHAEQFVHLQQAGASQQSHAVPGNGYGPELWLPGEIVDDVRVFRTGSAGDPGRALLETGLFQRDLARRLHRLDILDDVGQAAGDMARLGAVMIDAPLSTASFDGLDPAGARFADALDLVGLAVDGDPSVALTVDLGWRSTARVPSDYALFVHLLNEDGQIVAQQDAPPDAVLPTSQWLPGETLRSQVTLPPAADGEALRIGLYEPVSGVQLPVAPLAETTANLQANRLLEWYDSYIVLPLVETGIETGQD